MAASPATTRVLPLPRRASWWRIFAAPMALTSTARRSLDSQFRRATCSGLATPHSPWSAPQDMSRSSVENVLNRAAVDGSPGRASARPAGGELCAVLDAARSTRRKLVFVAPTARGWKAILRRRRSVVDPLPPRRVAPHRRPLRGDQPDRQASSKTDLLPLSAPPAPQERASLQETSPCFLQEPHLPAEAILARLRRRIG